MSQLCNGIGVYALLKDHTEKLHDEEIKHKNKIDALPMRTAKKLPMPK